MMADIDLSTAPASQPLASEITSLGTGPLSDLDIYCAALMEPANTDMNDGGNGSLDLDDLIGLSDADLLDEAKVRGILNGLSNDPLKSNNQVVMYDAASLKPQTSSQPSRKACAPRTVISSSKSLQKQQILPESVKAPSPSHADEDALDFLKDILMTQERYPTPAPAPKEESPAIDVEDLVDEKETEAYLIFEDILGKVREQQKRPSPSSSPNDIQNSLADEVVYSAYLNMPDNNLLGLIQPSAPQHPPSPMAMAIKASPARSSFSEASLSDQESEFSMESNVTTTDKKRRASQVDDDSDPDFDPKGKPAAKRARTSSASSKSARAPAVPPQRRERKRGQNKEAAQRYRMKKKEEAEMYEQMAIELDVKVAEWKEKNQKLEGEINIIQGLLSMVGKLPANWRELAAQYPD